jgi:hypothetical protein
VPRAKRGEIWMADLGLAAKVRPVLVLSVAYEGQERAIVRLCHPYDQPARYSVRSASRNSWHAERRIRRARSGFDTGDQTRKASGARRLWDIG